MKKTYFQALFNEICLKDTVFKVFRKKNKVVFQCLRVFLKFCETSTYSFLLSALLSEDVENRYGVKKL